jgi:hypothetical protein
MNCSNCRSTRVLRATAHCSDLFTCVVGLCTYDGDVPYDLGIGGGDDMTIFLCLNCGHVQGAWPLPESEIEKQY